MYKLTGQLPRFPEHRRIVAFSDIGGRRPPLQF